MNYILWIILGTNSPLPAPAHDHAEYQNKEACQHAADQIKASLDGVQFHIHTVCTPKDETK